jgi:PAS domain S-box-containing protein
VHVLLSITIAVLGSWTALDLNGRVLARTGRTRWAWLAATALAMGLSIWSMHFVAMLGFNAGVPVTYDVGLTILSLLLAVMPTAGAFLVLQAPQPSRRRVALAGLAMGTGICLMHYVGMSAVRAPATLEYRPALVALSFGIAVTASWAALVAVLQKRSLLFRAAGAVGLGLAIAAMHYTAMAGATFAPTALARAGGGDIGNNALTFAVASSTLLLLTTALITALFDRRFEAVAVREAQAEARRANERHLEAVFAKAAAGISEVSLEGRFVQVNDEFCHLLARSREELLALDVASVTHPDDIESNLAALERLRMTGEPASLDKRYMRSDGSIVWANSNVTRLDDDAGEPRSYLAVTVDLTERKRFEEHQRLLIDELNHRVKNTLAIVQGLAQQSFRDEGSAQGGRGVFEARLAALAAAHNVLTRESWAPVRVDEVVTTALSPFDEGLARTVINGPDLRIPPKTAVSLALALHELGTNAVKYGALSSASGRIEIRWSVEEQRLSLVWRETGGPRVEAPRRRGFGTRMIERGLAAELDGDVVIDFRPEGVVCTVDAPLPEAA